LYAIDELALGHTSQPAHDCNSQCDQFLREVVAGLTGCPKTLPCKYFYDERGSKLFDAICELDEYYPTRTELAIMVEHAPAMAGMFEPGDVLVELGSGSSVKTRLLLDRLDGLSAYVPVDISSEHLNSTAGVLRAAYPRLSVRPVAADYCAPFPVPLAAGRRVIVYFPGSTIGNFHPTEAVQFMRQIRSLCGPRGGLLIGVDLEKEIGVLERAYNDDRGVTALFNLNLLERMNKELGAGFDLDDWRHHAVYNKSCGRIEMHLLSARSQSVSIDGHRIAFDAGETIWTESSYKHTAAGFAQIAKLSGFRVEQVWTDPSEWFSVQMLRSDPELL
jgi:dimethylhistidine N-methyltransferase